MEESELERALLATDIVPMTDDASVMSTIKTYKQARYENDEAIRKRAKIEDAISLIEEGDLPPKISRAMNLPLKFVEKLTATTTIEEGYDMYLMHLFETARESIKNGEHIYQVLLKTQLSRDVLNMIRALDPETPLSAIFEELKNTGVYAWEPPFAPSVIAQVYS
jgi:hypothetical protein